jgi:hypothetical protein
LGAATAFFATAPFFFAQRLLPASLSILRVAADSFLFFFVFGVELLALGDLVALRPR